MGFGSWLGINKKGKALSAAERTTEETAQTALDKLVTGNKAFGNRTMSAADAEKQLRAQGLLPQGWRLRESDSTSSGYRPTQAVSKKSAALHAGMLAGAGMTGVGLAGIGPLAAASGLMSGVSGAAIQGGLGAAEGAEKGGLKGALVGGGIGAATGGFAPGAGGVASKLGTRMAVQGGLGAAQSLASGGGLKGALKGGAIGAASAAAPKVAPALTKNALGQKAINLGVNTGLNTAATGRFDPTGTAVAAGSTFLPTATGALTKNATGQRALNFAGTQGINLAASRFPGGGTGGGVGGGNNVVSGNNFQNYLPQNGAGDDTSGDEGWGTKYGPLIAQGAGILGGIYAGKAATKSAQQRSPEEQYALGGAQGAATLSGRAGSRLLSGGETDLNQARNYYSKLLGGNRALMTQAVAPGIASATDVYRGASRSMDQAGLRGAGRDVANADMARQRASHIAGLTTGVQPMAAEKLGLLGGTGANTGGSLVGQAGNIYGNLLTGGSENRQYARREGAETGKAIGGLARDLGEVWGKKKAGGTGGGTIPTPTPAPLPSRSLPTQYQLPTGYGY